MSRSERSSPVHLDPHHPDPQQGGSDQRRRPASEPGAPDPGVADPRVPDPRDFRLLAAGQALSWWGNGFQTIALAAAVVLSGGGAGQLGVVMACSVLAMLACTLFGGVWADRLQPRTVMVAADLIRMVSVAGMAVLFSTPGMTALIPMVVTPQGRPAAAARMCRAAVRRRPGSPAGSRDAPAHAPGSRAGPRTAGRHGTVLTTQS